jgi:hypothetical protein
MQTTLILLARNLNHVPGSIKSIENIQLFSKEFKMRLLLYDIVFMFMTCVHFPRKSLTVVLNVENRHSPHLTIYIELQQTPAA